MSIYDVFIKVFNTLRKVSNHEFFIIVLLTPDSKYSVLRCNIISANDAAGLKLVLFENFDQAGYNCTNG